MASWTPLRGFLPQALRCPRKRVNSTLRKAGATRGTLEDLTWATCVWADFDKLGDEEKSQTVERLKAFQYPPTLIVDSGGGLHVYWKLSQPLDMRNPEQALLVREVVHGLAGRLGADRTVHDPSRVLRVPGTYNVGNGRDKVYEPPREVKVILQEPGNIYAIDDLSQFRKVVSSKAEAAGDEVDIPRTPPPPPQTLNVSKELQDLINKGWSRGGKHPSRSELDFSVMVAMLEAGHTDDDIFATFMDPSKGIGKKFRDEGANGPHYLKQTLTAAKQRVALKPSDLLVIKLEDGKMKAWRSKLQVWRVIYSKPIIPIARYRGEKNAWLVEIPGELPVELDSTALSSATQLKRALPPAGAWTGFDRDVQELIPYFEQYKVPEKRSVDVIGLHGERVVFPNAILGPDGAVEKQSELVYTGNYRAATLRLTDNWDALARQVGSLLLTLHAPGAIHAIAGWFLATFVAPRIRELTSKGFPLLNVWGGTGSGKTTLLSLLWRLTGSTRDPLSIEGGTDFSRTMDFSSTNTLPMILDEHRAGRRLTKFYAMLREAFQGEEHERGRPDLTVLRLRLTSPIAVAGESALPEPALRQRALIVKLAHDQLGSADPPSEVRQAKSTFEALPLSEFNGGFYRHVKGKDVAALWQEEAARARQTLNIGSDERKSFGPIAALVGLRLFEEFLPNPNMDDVAKLIADGLDEDEEPSLVELIIVTIFKLLQQSVLRPDQDVKLEAVGGSNELYLSPSLVLDKIAAHFKREGSEMPTSQDALREALRAEHKRNAGQGIVKSMRTGKRIGGTSDKAIVLNLDKIEEVSGISVEQWRLVFFQRVP